MSRVFLVVLCSGMGMCVLLTPVFGRGAEVGFSAGYGIAALNQDKHTGRVEGGRYYDFFHGTLLFERPCQDYRQLAVFAEPFAAYVDRPDAGLDAGFYVGLKLYPMDSKADGPYLMGGTGMAYTTTKFREQGTHLLFTLEGGVGYRRGRFFLQDVLRHYSNGGTSSPNRSIQANILSAGLYF